MEEIKPSVTEKCHFEYGDEPVICHNLEFFDYQDVDVSNKLNFSSYYSYTSLKLSLETLMMEKIKPVATEKYQIECRVYSILLAYFSDYQDSDAGNKIDNFSFMCFSTSLRLSLQSSAEEIKPVALEK